VFPHRIATDLARALAAFVRAETRAHELLRNRIATIAIVSLLVDALGTALIFLLERHAAGTEVHTLGDAAFFTTVQLLTISSQLENPVTGWGRVVDIALELYALVVVTSLAGIFAGYFHERTTGPG
jgi:hypothetical protein